MREDLSPSQDLNSQSSPSSLQSTSDLTPDLTNNQPVDGGLINLLIFALVGVVALIGIGMIFYRWFRYQSYEKNKAKDRENIVFVEVAVPRETAEESQKDRAGSGTTDKDMIAQGEQIFGHCCRSMLRKTKTIGGPKGIGSALKLFP
jgi:hypothetical protein